MPTPMQRFRRWRNANLPTVMRVLRPWREWRRRNSPNAMRSLKAGPVIRDKMYSTKLRAAFPPDRAADVDAVMSIIVNDRRWPYYTNDSITALTPLRVRGAAEVRIPYRIYVPEPAAEDVARLTAPQHVVDSSRCRPCWR